MSVLELLFCSPLMKPTVTMSAKSSQMLWPMMLGWICFMLLVLKIGSVFLATHTVKVCQVTWGILIIILILVKCSCSNHSTKILISLLSADYSDAWCDFNLSRPGNWVCFCFLWPPPSCGSFRTTLVWILWGWLIAGKLETMWCTHFLWLMLLSMEGTIQEVIFPFHCGMVLSRPASCFWQDNCVNKHSLREFYFVWRGCLLLLWTFVIEQRMLSCALVLLHLMIEWLLVIRCSRTLSDICI